MSLFNPENCLILIVDDMLMNLQVMAETLESASYEITLATSGKQALERIKLVRPDLILLDLMMPGMNRFEVCDKIKADLNLSDIPIIFITASNEQEHILQAFDKGAVDYIIKPFNRYELLARVRTHLELRHTQKELKKMLEEQKELVKNLEKLANTDSLTGVWNRRYLLNLAEQETQRCRRYHRPLSVLMIDIDHFKGINDNYGHAIGDEVLIKMTEIVSNYLRSVDVLGRFGGEEFVALLPETNRKSALITAERIRENIEKITIPVQEKSVSITVSIGVGSYQKGDANIDILLQRADEALYKAKRQGRNRVIADHASEEVYF
ncbi:MAG: diguanylate cyclase [Cuspidothrix sp.]